MIREPNTNHIRSAAAFCRGWPKTLVGLAFLMLCAALPSAHADLVHLRNGRVLRGKVLEKGKHFIVLRVPYGQVKLSTSQIEYIEEQSELDYRLETGRDFLSQKRYIPAIAQLEKALSAEQDSEVARRSLAGAYASYAKHLHKVRRLAESRKYYEYLLKLEPDSREGRKGLASVSTDEGHLEELISEARALMAARDIDKAIEKFEKIMSFSGDARKSVSQDLGRCYAYRGEFLYRSKKYAQATAELEKAFEFSPVLADRLEDLYAASALSLVLTKSNAGQPGEARQDLKRILTFAPTNRNALYIAGRLEQALRNGPKAAEYYARGLKTRVAGYTENRMSQLRADLEKALGIPDGGARIRFSIDPMDVALYAESKPGAFATTETEHFKVQHYNKALGEEVGRVLEAHRARIARLTGLRKKWSDKAIVFLHRSQEEYTKTTGQPAWTGGVSRFQHRGGTIEKMQIHTWQGSPRLFKSVLPHEVAHLVVNTHLRSYGSLPRAIHEGLAVFMEPSFRHAYYINFLRARLKSKQFIPLRELLVMQDYPRDQEFFYAEGFALIAYLAQLKGINKMLDLIHQSGSAKDIGPRILRLSGSRSLEALEKSWKKWIMKGR